MMEMSVIQSIFLVPRMSHGVKSVIENSVMGVRMTCRYSSILYELIVLHFQYFTVMFEKMLLINHTIEKLISIDKNRVCTKSYV